jgi:predicted nucleic acid-binding protein
MQPSLWINSMATGTEQPAGPALELQLAQLPEGSLIAIDTAPLIFWLEGHPRWAAAYAALFDGLDAGRWQGLLSTITLAELLTGPLQQGRDELAERYAAALCDPGSFQLASLTPAIATSAARLRARYKLRLPDALQLATALQGGAQALVTHDRDFAGCNDLPILGLSRSTPPNLTNPG